MGLGWPQWLTIIGLVGGLIVTFWVMARASVHYERARQRREAAQNKSGNEPVNEKGTT